MTDSSTSDPNDPKTQHATATGSSRAPQNVGPQAHPDEESSVKKPIQGSRSDNVDESLDKVDESLDNVETRKPDEPKALKDELQVDDHLSRCIFFKDQKIFAAAGRDLPLLQMNTDGTFISLDPDLPYRPDVDEELVVTADEHGRLFDALGQIRKLSGMTFKGKGLFFVKERHPKTEQNLAAWFDDDMKPHHLYLDGELLAAIMILRMRDRMIDGELSSFEEISSD